MISSLSDFGMSNNNISKGSGGLPQKLKHFLNLDLDMGDFQPIRLWISKDNIMRGGGQKACLQKLKHFLNLDLDKG